MKSTTVFFCAIVSTIGYTRALEDNLHVVSENDDPSFFGDEILLTPWENDELWQDEKVIPVHESPREFFAKLTAQYDADRVGDSNHAIRKRETEDSITPPEASGDGNDDLVGIIAKENSQLNTENKDKLSDPISTNHSVQDNKPSTIAPTVVISTTKPVQLHEIPHEAKDKADTVRSEETDKVEIPGEKVIPAVAPSKSAHATTNAAPVSSSTTKLEKVEETSESVTQHPVAPPSTSKPVVSTANVVQSQPEESAAESTNSSQTIQKEAVELTDTFEEINPDKRPRKEPLDKEQSALAAFTDDKKNMEDSDVLSSSMAKKERSESLPEDVKSGESSEKSESRTDSKLLIFLGGAVLTIGVGAFTYNYVKKLKQKRHEESLQNGGAVYNEDPEAGKELKPLMKGGEKVTETEDSKVEIEGK